MSSKQLKHSTKIEGGFLGLLAGLAVRALPFVAKTVLPVLGVGALSGLALSGVQKAMGSGLYLKKGGWVSQVETDGSGLYSKPYKGQGLQSYGEGLYLSKEENSTMEKDFCSVQIAHLPIYLFWEPSCNILNIIRSIIKRG